jgi:Dullard-like phosphatase family protein
MNDNFKQINNYYLMIIDNLYSYNNNNCPNYNTNFYSFPNCLNFDISKFSDVEKQNIISQFFYETIKEKNNYSIPELKKFFNLYINKAKIAFSSFHNYDNNSIKNIQNRNNNMTNINNTFNQNYSKSLKVNHNINYIQYKSFLPPIQKPYIYTLVLDLDETLIHYKTNSSPKWDNPKKNMIILRPDLIFFLKEMKKIYELVLFSYATYDYIEKVLKIIESKEKFFEYILDRRHITYENGSYIKNLSLIGRDLKNVIIIDDKPQAFKMHKENGIFIKPFYGDCCNNKNILKNLAKILKDIRKDADINGDIRKCIQKKNHDIFTKITTGLIE